MRNKNTARNSSPEQNEVHQEKAFSLISDEKLIALYANLLECRVTEQHLGLGRNGIRSYEAATVGLAIDLEPGDSICGSQGMHTELAKGAPIHALLLASGHSQRNGGGADAKSRKQLAKVNSSSVQNQGVSQIHTALGRALADKTKKNGKVAVVFCDGAMTEAWTETIYAAAAHALPMVFATHGCSEQDLNGHAPRGRAKGKSPETPWFPTIVVDSNDVVAVYRVAQEAISRARSGRGPTLIACRPFVIADNANVGEPLPSDLRTNDPIINMERYLEGKGLLRRGLKSEILSGFRQESIPDKTRRAISR